MRRMLLELLVCPGCLPREIPLHATGLRGDGEEIESASLSCPSCGREYHVVEGIAHLLSRDEMEDAGRYSAAQVVSSYLFSQYADLLGETAATAYTQWAGLLGESATLALDAGCAAGRLTLAMGSISELAIGVDRSPAFIKAARSLLMDGSLDFQLAIEGEVTESRTIVLPEELKRSRAEFLVADVLRLPFPQSTFSLCASLNVLDKVADPLRHLLELNRTARSHGARLLFSDPFSWSDSSAPKELWLGGRMTGPFTGRGLDNVRGLLEGVRGLIAPPWSILSAGEAQWVLRTHANHCERIRSHFLEAAR
jgi:SAM-dependent methyltransferase